MNGEATTATGHPRFGNNGTTKLFKHIIGGGEITGDAEWGHRNPSLPQRPHGQQFIEAFLNSLQGRNNDLGLTQLAQLGSLCTMGSLSATVGMSRSTS